MRPLALLASPLLLALAFALTATSASAASCVTDGAVKRCTTTKAESCSTGPPYTCKRAKDVCTTRGRGAAMCVYTERRRICQKFGGTDCKPGGSTTCTTGPSKKRCLTRKPRECKMLKRERAERCDSVSDECTTTRRTGRFGCTFERERRLCDAKGCKYEILTCLTGSGRSKSCSTRFRKPTPATGGSSTEEAAPTTDGGTVESDPAPATDPGSSTTETEPPSEF